MKLWIAYGFFAVLATMVNLAAQDITTRLYAGQHFLMLSVAIGTIAGLLVKYLLDKRYIFRFQAKSVLHDSHTFLLYTLMGGATTLIFWGFEFGFQYLFDSKEMRYLGATLGLGIGYMAKYHLDRRYVFQKEALP